MEQQTVFYRALNGEEKVVLRAIEKIQENILRTTMFSLLAGVILAFVTTMSLVLTHNSWLLKSPDPMSFTILTLLVLIFPYTFIAWKFYFRHRKELHVEALEALSHHRLIPAITSKVEAMAASDRVSGGESWAVSVFCNRQLFLASAMMRLFPVHEVFEAYDEDDVESLHETE